MPRLAPGPSRDLYCIELFPVDPGGTAAGTAALEWVPGPFTVAVAPDGAQRFNLRLALRGLPPLPRGRRAGYVAWAAPPTLVPLQRLGVVREGATLAGTVAFDRFLVLVSAEPDTGARERRGAIVLRGESASNRLRPPDLFQFALGANVTADGMAGHARHGMADSLGWTTVPMLPGIPMPAAEMALRPSTAAWLPEAPPGAPLVQPTGMVTLADGDTLDLSAQVVRRVIGGREAAMFGFNGQHPGPLLRVGRGTEVVVRFHNRLPLPSTVHWHGLRLDAAFDGAAPVTQAPVAPGERFTYRLKFPDGGLYWYHPHVRDDIQQDLGLYGNILVEPASAAWPRVAREEFLLLDDLLVGENGLVPYGRDTPTHAAMGRIGNLLLVNGDPAWRRTVRQGETVRLFLTNAASGRTWNLGFDGPAELSLIGGDLGGYPAPIGVDHVVIAPAERQVVDVRFARPGSYRLLNRVRALDHLNGRFFAQVDTLGTVDVLPARGAPPPATAWRDTALARELTAFVARAPTAEERTLELGVTFTGLPFVAERLMRLDSIYFMPVEWAGTMPGMNWATLGNQAQWRLRDLATGRDNHAIGWRFRRGSLLRLRLVGARDVLHAMQHPIHLHGQRFVVLSVGDVPNPHLIWKDTVLVPAGGTVELLVDLGNPGPWMLHCHIAEHLGAGMMTTIDVVED